MKTISLLSLRFGLFAVVLALTACDTTTPKKPKPVPPSLSIDEKPWNRPRSWEGNSAMGGMMPQSH